MNIRKEGHDKLVTWVVFNAGIPIYQNDKAEDGQKSSFLRPSVILSVWLLLFIRETFKKNYSQTIDNG